MFTNLRTSAKGFFAKLILLVLVAMFAMWGIGDVFRSMGAGPSIVATVGKTPISVQGYQAALKRSNGQSREALAGLIDDLLIEKEENALGIVVDDDAVAQYLGSIPELRGKDGQFNKELYQRMLAGSGKSERRFVEDVRRDIAGKLLLSSLLGSVQIPEEMVAALYRAQEEQRTANIILLTPDAASAGAPSEQEVKAYYEAHPKDFTAPEYRTLSYVTLPLAYVQGKTEVPEEEIRRVYDERKDEYRGSERRQIENLEFDNEQDAKDAAKALSQGKSFANIAKSAPLSNKGKTELGLIGAEKLPPEAAEKVFALPEGSISDPLLAGFRWHLYRVSKIAPGSDQTLKEARAAIAREIAARSAQETAQKMMNDFEDTLAGGSTLEQAAEKIGQKVHTLGPITQEGNTPDGEKAALPPYANFLAVAFAAAEKDHSQAVQTPEGSYFLVRVDSISPAHVRPLAEVKQQAAKGALTEKTQAALKKMAQDASEKLRTHRKAADAPEGVASGRLKRASETVPQGALAGRPLPQRLIGELFHIRPGQSTHAYAAEDGDYMIATLTSVIPAPQKVDPKALEEIRRNLKTLLTEEALQRYLAYLRGKYPVSINAAALGARDEQNGE